ncbi:VOC family protein [Kribbella speibonae]|uniref:VOC family protein n=1 Tax=Kribbella speibonae TaxID=1572660 RepID=A0ABY2AEH1_9ACTN|nr:VOC family protein [Kribbella speibonae]TCC28073.1 VOC family protein [Kribbella speibonae]
MSVKELRLVVTVDDYDAAVAFYRDALGLPERESYTTGDAQVMILEAGRATLELANRAQAEYIDEVGRRVAGKFRVALEVDDSADTTTRLTDAGATVVAEPTRTPWDSLNARLETPGGIQLTLFTELDLK